MKPEHKAVLTALDDETRIRGEYCVGFKFLAYSAGMDDIAKVRRITRHLKRKGFAEFHKGLFTEDGYPAGSGYCITPEGRAALEASK